VRRCRYCKAVVGVKGTPRATNWPSRVDQTLMKERIASGARRFLIVYSSFLPSSLPTHPLSYLGSSLSASGSDQRKGLFIHFLFPEQSSCDSNESSNSEDTIQSNLKLSRTRSSGSGLAVRLDTVRGLGEKGGAVVLDVGILPLLMALVQVFQSSQGRQLSRE
jgi:hypothetical protein